MASVPPRKSSHRFVIQCGNNVVMSFFDSRPWLPSYPEGVPSDIPAPTQTLTDMLDTSIKRYGRKVALDFFGQTSTYREVTALTEIPQFCSLKFPTPGRFRT